jgi:hypothetical protein
VHSPALPLCSQAANKQIYPARRGRKNALRAEQLVILSTENPMLLKTKLGLMAGGNWTGILKTKQA